MGAWAIPAAAEGPGLAFPALPRPLGASPAPAHSPHPSCLLVHVAPLFHKGSVPQVAGEAGEAPVFWGLTLHQKVDDDGVEAPSVGGCAGVVTRVLSLHSTQQQRAIGVDEPVPIHGHGDG